MPDQLMGCNCHKCYRIHGLLNLNGKKQVRISSQSDLPPGYGLVLMLVDLAEIGKAAAQTQLARAVIGQVLVDADGGG